MSQTLHGTHTITVGEAEYTLKPTLAAVRSLEQRFGGLRPVLISLQDLSISACTAVIAAGAGLAPKQQRDLEEQVFAAGVSYVAPELVAYVADLFDPSGSKRDAEESEGNGPA